VTLTAWARGISISIAEILIPSLHQFRLMLLDELLNSADLDS